MKTSIGKRNTSNLAGAIPALTTAVAAALLAGGLEAGTVERVVTTSADSGPGSLRAALVEAHTEPDHEFRISFGERDGLFATPRTIELTASLPPIRGQITIDGFIDNLLWKSYGATISGHGRNTIFEVLPGATLNLRGITLIEGFAENGGAIVNHGRLIVDGVSFFDNRAENQGGAIVNFGNASVINSTFSNNRAADGGALAGPAGKLEVIHATLHANQAERGAAIWSEGELHLANSILSGPATDQCFNAGQLSKLTTHNLIEGRSEGCGTPLLTAAPRLQTSGYFNGPTPTMPLSGASPALNLGLVAAAVDASGNPLKWDQRGNGDPRLAGGYPDLGAFEYQSQLPKVFVVDTIEDNGLRGCTLVGPPDCSLRAALELSAAARNPTPIRFDPETFREPVRLVLTGFSLETALPGAELPIVIDGEDVPAVIIEIPPGTGEVAWRAINGVRIEKIPDSAQVDPREDIGSF